MVPFSKLSSTIKTQFSKIEEFVKDIFFFAESFYNIPAHFNLDDQNNNLVLNFESYISIIHANFFQVEIDNRETGKKEKIDTYYDIGCKQIYLRVPESMK